MNIQLRRLIQQYIDGEIAYAPFREQFVREYLSVLHQDLELERNVNAIENVCADFDEGDILPEELQAELLSVATRPTFSVQVNGVMEPKSRSSSALYLPAVAA